MSLDLAVGFLGIVMLIIGIVFVRVVKQRIAYAENGSLYPKGYWFGIGIAFGLIFGIPLGLALGIYFGDVAIGIAIGPALGMGLGSAMGSILEKRHAKSIRPMTDEETRLQRIFVVFIVSVLVLGVTVLFSLVYLYSIM